MTDSMFHISVGRRRGLQRCFWPMVKWIATWYLGGFSNFPMAHTDVSANAWHQTCRVYRTWSWQRFNGGAPSRIRQKWKCTPQCTSSTKGNAILSSSWPSSSFKAVANQVFCGSCGYIPHVCRNAQWWMRRNGAQIPGFTKYLSIHNYTQSGRDRPKSYTSKPCSNSSEVMDIESAAAGICMSCPATANVMREESTPRYTQLEVFLLSIPLSCLTIGLDIGLIQGLIAGSLWSFTQVQKVIRME